MNSRLSRLNRNLLLLAKMENNQFSRTESVDVITVIKDLQPYLESLSGGLILKQNFSTASLPIKANRSFLESMVNNLVVNAVRHNKTGGEITVSLSDDRLTISNTSDDAALDAGQIFNRFYRPSEKTTGNGLGLSIARAIAKHPKIYLFDDSFSALDYKTDVALRRALKAETGDATVIIVAQRISTVLHANQILVLEDGRIVGKGTHAQLMESCPAYQEIARSQLSNKELDLKGGEA